jgi:hypothetical protein
MYMEPPRQWKLHVQVQNSQNNLVIHIKCHIICECKILKSNSSASEDTIDKLVFFLIGIALHLIVCYHPRVE